MLKPRLLLCALALGIAASLGFGQWLERTVLLPDSLGSPKKLMCLDYDQRNDLVYMLDGAGTCLVVDAGTRERATRFPVCDAAWSAQYVPSVNKLYVVGYFDCRVFVVDCATRQVMDTLEILAADFCYDSSAQKLYCTRTHADTIYAIDVHSDSVVSAIHTASSPGPMLLNPITRKLYCAHAGLDSVSVIDANKDSVIAIVHVGTNPDRLCIDMTDDKVYVGASQKDRDYRVAIIDGASNSFSKWVSIGSQISLTWNSIDDKIYCASAQDTQLVVLDGATDRQIARMYMPLSPMSLNYCASANVVCCGTSRTGLCLIDGQADTVLGVADVIGNCDRLEVDDGRGLVWCTSSLAGSPAAVVVDCVSADQVGVVYSGIIPAEVCYVPSHDRLYVTDDDIVGRVISIDGTTGFVRALVDAGRQPTALCYIPASDRVYCPAYSYLHPEGEVAVIDPATDSVMVRITTPRFPFALAYNSSRNLVYVGHAELDSAVLTVIDAARDSIVGRLFVDGNALLSMLYDPAHSRLYCATSTGKEMYAVIVDCSTGAVIAKIPIGIGSWDVSICTSGDGHKVYFAASDLAVVDGVGDSLLRTLETGRLFRLAYNKSDAKVYGAGADMSFVVDATADTLLREIPEGFYDVKWDSAADRAYWRSDSSVVVFDGRTDDSVACVRVGRGTDGMALSTTSDRLYVAGRLSSAVFFLRGSGSGGIGDIVAHVASGRLEPTFAKRSLYLPGQVSVPLLDAAGRKASVLQPGPNDISRLAPGVYFVRKGLGTRGEGLGKTSKIVVTR